MSKLETKSKKAFIGVSLAGRVYAMFGADTRIAITEQFPSVYFEIKRGRAMVKGTEGKTYDLLQGDRYEAKKNLLE